MITLAQTICTDSQCVRANRHVYLRPRESGAMFLVIRLQHSSSLFYLQNRFRSTLLRHSIPSSDLRFTHLISLWGFEQRRTSFDPPLVIFGFLRSLSSSFNSPRLRRGSSLIKVRAYMVTVFDREVERYIHALYCVPKGLESSERRKLWTCPSNAHSYRCHCL